MALDRNTRRRLRLQRLLGRLAAPLLVPLLTLVMRCGFGYRIRDLRQLRARYRALRSERRPLLICSNHLTMVDSALITWALGSSAFYALHFSALPWNLPERRNFGGVVRVLVYLLKCIPIVRGGKRSEVARVLESVEHLMAQGEPAMIFPEAGRSRTGYVSTEAPAQGVGRLIANVPDCRVLCVYLRGDHQRTWSNLPARGDRFTIELSVLEPQSEHTGMRRSRHLTQQVVQRLAEMEARYFAAHGERPDPEHALLSEPPRHQEA